MDREDYALLLFSSGCNSDCVFCLRNTLRDRRTPTPPPNPESLKSFLALCRIAGIDRVYLGGDEPTVAGETLLRTVAGTSSDSGFREIALCTNGIELHRKEFVHQLIDWGVNTFYLPLYGPPQVHDAVLQRRGAFDALEQALGHLLPFRNRVAVHLHTLLLRQNETHLESIREFAARRRLSLNVRALHRGPAHVDFTPLVPLRRDWADKEGSSARTGAIRFDVLAGRIDLEDDEGNARRVIELLLKKSGLPAEKLPPLLDGFSRKPLFKDPTRLAHLLGLVKHGDLDHPELGIVTLRSAAEATRMGHEMLRRGHDPEALRAFTEALRFKAYDEMDHQSHAEAQKLVGHLAVRRRRGPVSAEHGSHLS